jgi:hypothetical protein
MLQMADCGHSEKTQQWRCCAEKLRSDDVVPPIGAPNDYFGRVRSVKPRQFSS